VTDLLTWQDAWDVVNEQLSAVALIALAANPDKKWAASHHDNDRFPFSGVASFLPKDDPNAPEDLVISIEVHRDQNTLTWSSEITTGGGAPLAEGPSFVVSAARPLVFWLDNAVDETMSWLRDQTPAITNYLGHGTPFPS
jgi:hypothetical protein